MSGAEAIAAALGAAQKSGRWWRCRCPVHNSTGATLAISDRSPPGLTIKCHAGCSRQSVAAELRRRGLMPNKGTGAAPDPETVERQREKAEQDLIRRARAAGSIWRETISPNHIVETYLGSRLILGSIPDTIRLHPSLRHREGNARRPAMVGVVEHPTEGRVAVHCTYLAIDGSAKACLTPNKRTVGPASGGAVRLGPLADTIAITEGIESGLSYQEATGTPTWAALSAGGIRRLLLPEQVSHVVIAADPDPVGIMAARAAAAKWLAEGRRVSIARPPIGLDFNDLARAVLG